MKRTYAALFLLLSTFPVWADNSAPKDTTKVVDIEEIVVIASPKENTKLRQLPTSVSLISKHDMQAQQITSLKSISNVVPNIFIPDYGSKLTSAVYIRGIGARINTPAVGLYVDNVPYIDKSAFDFNYYDIERIDILRGPQGTLYGRNTMGGLIKVHTRSPFTYQGTDIKLGAGTYNNYNASVTKYHRVNEKFAFSAGGFYQHEGGYFTNQADGKKIDPLDAGGGRVRAIWLPKPNLKFDLNIGYEYSDQGGYAYGAYDKATGNIAPVNYNDKSGYWRSLLNTSLNVEYQGNGYTLSAVTGYQHLKDRMTLDQDFTPKSVYTMSQAQKLNAITEEITFKGTSSGNWQWVAGAFGFYQALNTDGPVTFKADGMKMMEDMINKSMEVPRAPEMKLTFNDDHMLTTGKFKTPVASAALYHQSTFNNLFTKGLSLTVGLRLDYEKNYFDYDSETNIGYGFSMSKMGVNVPNLQSNIKFKGKTDNDYWQLLPKFALKYEFSNQNNIYASVARGYRSGGYNVQMFSDLTTASLQNSMMSETVDAVVPIMANMMHITEEAARKMLSTMMPAQKNVLSVEESTVYKPEYSWNYEIGSHLTLFDKKLWLDLSAFYMDTRDQQVARFANTGLGRMTVNAGKSRSIGAEVALRASITDAFSINVAYGYTNAKFKDYQTNSKNSEENDIDYSGNYVPLVPQNTLNVGGEYVFRLNRSAIKDITLNANYCGAGKIYYTESNDVSQDFYGTLNASVGVNFQNLNISVWGQNLLNKSYSTFYFETIDADKTMADKAGFMQKGKPVHFGVDVRYRF